MQNLYKVAEKDNLKLEIFYDESGSLHPREDFDNIGTMVCFHSRYNLGDKHNFSDDEEFVHVLAEDLGIETDFEDENGDCQDRTIGDIFQEVREKAIIMPVYLYDHSGITISTSSFDCSWDSGQVGWIYCTKQRLIEETGYAENELFSSNKHRMPVIGERVKIANRDFGQVKEFIDDKCVIDFDYNKVLNFKKPENLVTVNTSDITEVLSGKAVEMLESEIELYDHFLRGNVYGFVLSEKNQCECCNHVEWEEIDSCWGFFGDDVKTNGIADSLSSQYQELIDLLKFA